MKNNETEFAKLVSRLKLDDRPTESHRESVRRQMLAEFNRIAAKKDSATDGLHRIWRTIMQSRLTKAAVAAIVIVAILIGIGKIAGNDETKPIIVKDTPTVEEKIDIDMPSIDVKLTEKLAIEAKLAGELYAAGDIDGLIAMLETGELPSKVLVANYLADLGADEAFETIEKLANDWTGEGENPFAKAIETIELEVAKKRSQEEEVANDIGTSVKNIEVDDASGIVDANSITDIYVIEGALREDGFHADKETWFKGTKYYRMEDSRSIVVDNGVSVLVLDKEAKTAQMQKSGNRKGTSFEYVKLLLASVQSGDMSSLFGHSVVSENGKSKVERSKVDIILLADKSDGETLVYQVEIEDSDDYMMLIVDAKTSLLDRTLSGSKPGRGEQWQFSYDKIPMEKFSIEIPDDYEKLMAPKFVGRVVDVEGNPMDNFDIYVIGYPWGSANGKSDIYGNFEFEIPTDQSSPSGPMRCPLFVRAVSDKYPGWVGWTIIQNPNNINNNLLDWVPGQANIEAIEDSSRNCAGVWGVKLIVEPASEINGIIVDRHNNPIANASVTANIYTSDQSFNGHWSGLPGAGERGLYTVKTDDQGRYTISGIPGFAWIDFDEGLSDKEIAKRKRRRHININVSVTAKGYINKSGNGLDVKDELLSQSFDFVLSRADVTIAGRVVNNYGKPILDRLIFYGEGNRFTSQDLRTDKNGTFKLVSAPACDDLKIKVGSNKPHNWDKSKATKGKEYKYYMDKTIDVGFEEGTYEYNLGDIVLEEPELTVEFEVKDTSSQPIEGLEVSFRNHSMDHYWQQQFRTRTDVNGKCVFEKFPNLEEALLGIQWHFTGEAKSDQEQQQRECLRKFNSVYTDVELPGDQQGYYIEVTVPRNDEDFRGDKIRIYASDGQLVWPTMK